LALVSLATSDPPWPYAQWTHESLAAVLAKKKHPVSPEWVGRALRSIELDIVSVESWCGRRETPDFWKRAKQLCKLYNQAVDGKPVICIDEKTQVHVCTPVLADLPAQASTEGQPGRRRRRGFEYERHGTFNFRVAHDLSTGFNWTWSLEKNDAWDAIQFLERLVPQLPDDTVLVWDNAPSHKAKVTTALLADHNITVVNTPPHASWLNRPVRSF
jgi:hypothetical protein